MLQFGTSTGTDMMHMSGVNLASASRGSGATETTTFGIVITTGISIATAMIATTVDNQTSCRNCAAAYPKDAPSTEPATTSLKKCIPSSTRDTATLPAQNRRTGSAAG